MSDSGLGISWLGLGAVLVVLAVIVWLWARARQGESGLPSGDVIYSDTGMWHKQREALYSRKLRLAGKPDYLVQEPGGAIVPVEVKSRSAPAKPYEGHILQLAAYCLLVHETFGQRPDYGIIQYRDRAFSVDFTDDLEEDLLDLLDEMREDMSEGELDRDHDNRQICAHCGLRDYCLQRID